MDFSTAGAALELHLPQLPASQEQTFEITGRGKWLDEEGTDQLFGHFQASLVGFVAETGVLRSLWSDMSSMDRPEGQRAVAAMAWQGGRGQRLSVRKGREKPSGIQSSRSGPWPARRGGKRPWQVREGGKNH